MKSTGTKTGLFLMELVLALLLFSLCAAICMNIFATAKQRARESDALSKGVFAVVTAAECFKTADGDMDETQRLLGAVREGDSIVVHYDENWMPTMLATAYELTLTGLDGAQAEIAVTKNGQPVYALTVKAVSADA